MKKTQKISVTPTKKKQSPHTMKSGANPKITKLSTNILHKIQSFLTETEKLFSTKLNKVFKKAFCDSNSIDVSLFTPALKFIFFYRNLKQYASNFSPYLNTAMNINFINISMLEIDPAFNDKHKDIIEKSKIAALKYYLNTRYFQTKNNRVLISIRTLDEVAIYQQILPLLDGYKSFKYSLYINPEINGALLKEMPKLIELYKITPYMNKYINRSDSVWGKVQTEIFTKEIECMHFKIISKSKENIELAEKYFTKFSNNLICVDNESVYQKFQALNSKSLKIVSSSPFQINEMAPELRLRKIKFMYSESELDDYANFNENLENIEEFGGVVTYDENVIELATMINEKMPNLKSIHRIQLGEEMDDEELMTQFCDAINKKEKIEKIRSWFHRFSKGKDYAYLLKTFPNLRVIQEDYDASGLYDSRFEINSILSCNAEDNFTEQDLDALTKLLKNSLEHKHIGNKNYSFTLSCNIKLISILFDYLSAKNEKELLSSVNSINNLVSDGTEFESPIKGIEILNYFNLNSENENLISGLSNIHHIIFIHLANEDIFHKHFEFIKKVKPIVINACFNTEIRKEILEKINSISTIRFLIVSSQSARDNILKLQLSLKYKIFVQFLDRDI